MLELLTGRRSHDRLEWRHRNQSTSVICLTFLSVIVWNILHRTRPRGEQFLARWAVPQLHDIEALSNMVDPALNGNYPAKSLSNFADIISRCLQVIDYLRPVIVSLFISSLFYGINFFSLNVCNVMQSEPEFRPAMSEVVLYLLNMIKKESQQGESNEKWEWWWHLFVN